jgi:hypothetical protein
MAWTTDIVMVVRGLINDMDSPYDYSDTRLKQLICIAGVLLIQEASFTTSYTIDLSEFTITPDPSSDADFVALVSLKTACMILNGEHKNAANSSLSVKDGPAFIDSTSKAKQLGELAKSICEAYNKAKFSYLAGDGSVGRIIIGPYNAGNSSDSGRNFG